MFFLLTIVAQAYEQHSGRHLLGYGKSNNQTGLVVSVGSVFLMYTSKIVINYNENKNHTELSVETNDWNYTSGADCPHTNNITSSKSVYIFLCKSVVIVLVARHLFS